MNYCPTCNETGKSQGDHRFVLEQPGERMLLVVGLNPSTADETHPDPTVRKVVGFAEGGGYDGFAMLNLSSERCDGQTELVGNVGRRDVPEKSGCRGRSAATLSGSGHIGRFRKRYFDKTLFETVFSGFIQRAACESGAMVSNRETYGERKSPPFAYARYDRGLVLFEVEKYMTNLNNDRR